MFAFAASGRELRHLNEIALGSAARAHHRPAGRARARALLMAALRAEAPPPHEPQPDETRGDAGADECDHDAVGGHASTLVTTGRGRPGSLVLVCPARSPTRRSRVPAPTRRRPLTWPAP